MTDGRCGSTCALLATLLRAQGLRTVAFGGRPRRGAPMQALGAVRGGQYYSFATIHAHVSRALELAEGGILPPDQARRLAALATTDPAQFPLRVGAGGGSVNFRSAYGEDDDRTPLQFVHEPADCRLFLTVDNVFRPETTWAAAARAMFGGGRCA